MSQITNDGSTRSGTQDAVSLYPYMATVGVKGLKLSYRIVRTRQFDACCSMSCWPTWH